MTYAVLHNYKDEINTSLHFQYNHYCGVHENGCVFLTISSNMIDYFKLFQISVFNKFPL